MSSPASLRALSLLALFVAACGGGGSDAPAPASSPNASAPNPPASPSPPPASPSPPPAAPSPPAPAPGPAPSGVLSTCNLPDFANALMARINQHRAAGASCGARGNFGATGALAWEARLTQAADAHSRDMATRNYFSHTSADGRTLADRITATGYPWSTVGENIAAGQRSVDQVMNGWMASDGHCANVMNPQFTQIGVACVNASGASYPTYWTMNLGRPR